MVRFWYTPPRKFFSGQPNQSIIGFIKKELNMHFFGVDIILIYMMDV